MQDILEAVLDFKIFQGSRSTKFYIRFSAITAKAEKAASLKSEEGSKMYHVNNKKKSLLMVTTICWDAREHSHFLLSKGKVCVSLQNF